MTYSSVCVCVFKKGNGTKSVLYFGEGLVGSWPVGSSLGGQGWDALRVCLCVCQRRNAAVC